MSEHNTETPKAKNVIIMIGDGDKSNSALKGDPFDREKGRTYISHS